MALPSYATPAERVWYYSFRVICGLIFFFLLAPIIIMMPLSFNAQPYFTFTREMLTFNPEGYSLRWYQDLFSSDSWMRSIRNSFIIGIAATALATTLGTLAALGLSRAHMPFKGLIMGILISPMIVPLIISAAGMFFFFSSVNLAQTYLGVILAHTALGTPFVVITVTATLVGFDESLTRAAANLGASPTRTFFKVTMPLILPGVISGALFAFITSFDEIVIVLFVAGVEQRTIPREMWSGIREQISPTILAVATILVLISIALLTTLELLRRRSERLRGLSRGGRNAEPARRHLRNEKPGPIPWPGLFGLRKGSGSGAFLGQCLDLAAEVRGLVAVFGPGRDQFVGRAFAGQRQRPDDRAAVARGAIGQHRPLGRLDRRALGLDMLHAQGLAGEGIVDEAHPLGLHRPADGLGRLVGRSLGVGAVADHRGEAGRANRRRVF
jgi:putative spermidine/putrescine transport system permease protein